MSTPSQSINDPNQQAAQIISRTMKELRQLPLTDTDRYGLFPLKDEVSWRFYVRQEAASWHAKEVKLDQDRRQMKTLSPVEYQLVFRVVAFFVPTDGLVADNILMHFILSNLTMESRMFYIAQLHIEAVHAETYARIAEELFPEEERLQLFQAADKLDCVKIKSQWLKQYSDSDLNLPYLQVVFACAEGIFFNASFFYVFWFRSKNLLPGFIQANELISRDEELHRQYACWQVKKNLASLDQDLILKIVRDAVEIETLFAKTVLPEPITDQDGYVDLSAEMAINYTKHLANRTLYDMGLEPSFEVDLADIPAWMKDISVSQKTNTFEKEVSSYTQFSVKEALIINTASTEDFYQNPENFC